MLFNKFSYLSKKKKRVLLIKKKVQEESKGRENIENVKKF
jgi:hypothetical protein